MKFQQGTGSCFWGLRWSIRDGWALAANLPGCPKHRCLFYAGSLPSLGSGKADMGLERLQDKIPRLARKRGTGPKATFPVPQLQLRASV